MVYQRASNKTIYLNLAVNSLKKLRDEGSAAAHTPGKNSQTPKSFMDLLPSKSVRPLSHAEVLRGKLGANQEMFTVNRSGGPSKDLDHLGGWDHCKSHFSVEQTLMYVIHFVNYVLPQVQL